MQERGYLFTSFHGLNILTATYVVRVPTAQLADFQYLHPPCFVERFQARQLLLCVTLEQGLPVMELSTKQ